MVKIGKSSHIDSPPLSVFQQLVSEQVPLGNNLTTGRYIMERKQFYRNGIPQFDGQIGLKYELWSKRMKTFYRHMDMIFGTQLL